MRINLFYKLFGAFFLSSVIIVGLWIFVVRYYVSDNFTRYVNKFELELQHEVMSELIKVYSKDRNWNSLRHNKTLWIDILSKTIARNPTITPHNPLYQLQPGHPGSSEMHEVEKEFAEKDFKQRKQLIKHRLSNQHPSNDNRPIKLAVFDKNKQAIVGNVKKPEQYILKPIKLNKKTIGWLGLRKRRQLSNPLDISFLKQQTQLIYTVGGGILSLSLVISFLLSRHILSPINSLTKGTRAIADRKFETRITVKTRDELADLANDFNTMAETLEKFEDQRKQWISDITHELGTPLSILQGEIEAVQDGIRQIESDTLESLHAEVLHLSKIVNDLRELSLAETGGLSFKKDSINPLNVITDTISIFEKRFSKRQLTLDVNLNIKETISTIGDRDRLQQVFSNIFENTLRYADSPGTISIRAGIEEQKVHIRIEDSGPGVPEGSLEHLFDRLYRVEQSRNRAIGGSGLGLAICKHIINAHDGEIKASNVPGNGLRIEITLPKT